MPAMACCQPASSDLRPIAYPWRASNPPINDTPPEKNRTTQTTARAGNVNGARIFFQRYGAATSQLQNISFMLSHSQGANTKTLQAEKMTLAAHTKQRASMSLSKKSAIASIIDKGNARPKFQIHTQRFHPVSPIIQTGNHRMPEEAEKKPVTRRMPTVAG